MFEQRKPAFQIAANHAISNLTPRLTDMTEVCSAAPNPHVCEMYAVFISGYFATNLPMLYQLKIL
jgi:hypothetical protein